jgi:hypothetical protein
VDLVALRWEISFPIEVKTSKHNTLHFSTSGGRAQQQAEEMKSACESIGFIPLYAFRLKKIRGDSWRIFTLGYEHKFKGIPKKIYEKMPKISVSKSGKYVLRWEEGWALNEFLSYITH